MSNPFVQFESAIQAATARKALEDAAAERQKAADAEALQAKVAADAALRSALEEERRLNNFIGGFVHAVITAAETRRWSPTAIQAAQRYCMALAARPEVTIPKIDPKMGEIINDRFAYGVVLQADFPSDWLNGQRQEWFPELFAKKSGQATNNRLNIRPGDRPRVYSSTSTANPVANPLPAATTPRAKGKDPRPAHLRMGRPGGRRKTAA